uniref:Uncharacterized protein n=1 Tax=Aegilops tauschii subsp. strangulata TaxID=200361 RepID=A0A453A8A4_AEGTS
AASGCSGTRLVGSLSSSPPFLPRRRRRRRRKCWRLDATPPPLPVPSSSGASPPSPSPRPLRHHLLRLRRRTRGPQRGPVARPRSRCWGSPAPSPPA